MTVDIKANGSCRQIPFNKVHITDAFWTERMKVHQDVTLDLCIKRCEETDRIKNFITASKGENKGAYVGRFYNDSDVYKVLEGAAYSLMHQENKELEKKIDEIIGYIGSAQEENGYLMAYYTVEEPEGRWTNLDRHEMYCGGHLIEAAVAYYQSTGKRNFLDIACKLVDHYMDTFGPDKRNWVPGHEEIELALVRLYEVTGEEKHLRFAYWLLEQRGKGYGSNEGDVKFEPTAEHISHPEYYQNNVPVKDIEKVVGHAVRAMYLYTGMADVSKYVNTDYEHALRRVWDNVVNKNLYITGGIGPSKKNEGFTVDYDLPNKTAYCETCAGIGLTLWNARMSWLEGHGKYMDVVERSLYNNIIAGWALGGDTFFYVNPLAADGTHNRKPWYNTACCPTNLCRFIPSIGQYIYCIDNDEVVVNLFIDSEVEMAYKGHNLRLIQETTYPVSSVIKLRPEYEGKEPVQCRLRVPEWCNSFTVQVNDKEVLAPVTNGYIQVTCENGQTIELNMDMPVRLVLANEKVTMNEGKVAIVRGPIVYALEQQDQDQPLADIKIPSNALFRVSNESIGGLPKVICYSRDGQKLATCIPYFTWNNRGEDAMQVWCVEEKAESLYY
ncbi:glycoside hydrolase family 127 protein [Vallitalea okinawensis]|uniref:glycoside hydrolase family 127 protein n=1 Tax=Vallitalea okinawensis TaxID=2078660 RepID=UPI000CFAE30C|nr:beta-L-arabinofuranosidase domain-containing protein [Vallitalea okinawensis]